MSQLKLVLYPSPILKQKADALDAVTDEVRVLLDDMVETMYANRGIGLAGPQVGESIRVAVIDVRDEEQPEGQVYKLVNPRIVERSGSVDFEEGCLSIPGVHETVRRSEKVTVQALNERGEEIEIAADGLLAICLQHEIDHLDGILFIDKLSTLRREFIRPRLREIAEGKFSKEDE